MIFRDYPEAFVLHFLRGENFSVSFSPFQYRAGPWLLFPLFVSNLERLKAMDVCWKPFDVPPRLDVVVFSCFICIILQEHRFSSALLVSGCMVSPDFSDVFMCRVICFIFVQRWIKVAEDRGNWMGRIYYLKELNCLYYKNR